MSRAIVRRSWVLPIIAFIIVNVADTGAQRGARGAARMSVNRSASVNRSFNRDLNVNRSVDVNRNVNVNRNLNRNIDVDRDIDVDVDHRYYGGGYGCCYHPVARA